MKKRLLAMAVVCAIILSVDLPTKASAASSSEIKKQINALKEEKEAIQEKIAEVQAQYEENEDEIANIIAQKM